VGTVPVLGDAFDVGWKSNRKNFTLLQAYQESKRRSQTWREWAFLLALMGTVGLLLVAPFVLLLLAIHWLRR
jgi:type II secretory pathway component PulL